MNNDTPRIRSLLRQAERNVDAGKNKAAELLYRQILEEAPENPAAWLGLARVASSDEERREAYAKAVELDPAVASSGAPKGAAEPSKDAVRSAPASATRTAPETAPSVAENRPGAAGSAQVTAVPASDGQDRRFEFADNELELVCYRHPQRPTSLRCYKCNQPICSECTVKTPVGYLCPTCYREMEDQFFNARPTDYLLAALVALPLGLLAGFLVMQFSRGLFFIIIMFFIGGAVGGLIGRITKRVIGGRRGRYIPHLVAGCVIIGVLIWALPALLSGAFFALIGPGVYLATAVGSAYYWAR